MPDVIRRNESEDGELTALDLRRLLLGVPDEAVIEINQNDLDDYRNKGQARWWFKARWSA